ncbi:Protein of unknown function [Blastococcus aurantiacus]|uniref:DUF3152 domain-containing protein n=1 Tax=Blastococcus aurantiacus TaxID=1550231 RepID=A0A1G7KX69_9ACTN|nr:DUF3152 domain-containing protein [Blastococcus aurantiacus]SDF41510.1 Protein of unknown function [Blastococcus aurantiacus]
MSGRRTDGRVDLPSRPGRPRTRPRSGPLVAAPDPDRVRRRVRPADGPVRGFVRRYGWRAYAIPLLTLATLVALVDVAVNQPAESDPAASSSRTTAVTPSVLPLPDDGRPSDAPAQGDAEPTGVPAPSADAATYVERGAGSVSVVDGSSPVYGTGPLRRFVVEVEDGIEVDGAGFAEAVEETLGDPRSWGSGGRMSFQRVGAEAAEAGEYEFRVSLVSPGSMETYCPGVGTGGYTSCRYGERAVINLARWATAVPDYQGDVATYRRYVVNHEVGHALGNGHEDCPGAGQLAPVMQQQTLGLKGCTKNAWPYP